MSLKGMWRYNLIEEPWKPDDRQVGGGGNQDSVEINPLIITIFIASHVPLAVVMRSLPSMAAAHALAVLLSGLIWAVRNSVERVAYLSVYIAGTEVLWRMNKAPIPWEFGRIATSLILSVSLLRGRAHRLPIMPLIYFALLTPSIALVVGNSDLGRMRSDISMNMSGPLSLTLAACFFSRLEIAQKEFVRIFLTLLAPIVGITSLLIIGIASAESLQFNTESNFATSGGYGPNQVSTTLGLGSLVALLCFLIGERRPAFGASMLGMSIALAVQSALTFSRSGLYCMILSAFAAFVFVVRSPVILFKAIVSIIVIFGVSYFLVIPAVDKFTGGMIAKRFTERTTSHRYEFVMEDYYLWASNPFFGVGIGGSKAVHGGAATHSEASRLLAEHGLPGLVALLLLAIMGTQNLLRSKTPYGRALYAALGSYFFLLIITNGMRLVAPSLIYGLCFATFRANVVRDRLR